MVECEYVISSISQNHSSVLIDTWWNVNIMMFITMLAPVDVLIDTWWNVNLHT